MNRALQNMFVNDTARYGVLSLAKKAECHFLLNKH
jgi:hypothetical protein